MLWTDPRRVDRLSLVEYSLARRVGRHRWSSVIPQMAPVSNTSSRKHWWDIDPPLWLGLLLCALLIIVLIAAPIAASRFLHPWAGVAVAVLALPAWLYLGPRPMPGFLNGFVAVNGFLLLVAMLVIAVLRALHGGGAAG